MEACGARDLFPLRLIYGASEKYDGILFYFDEREKLLIFLCLSSVSFRGGSQGSTKLGSVSLMQ